MTEKEMLKMTVLSEKGSEAYKLMRERYIELKVILTISGVNLTELDRIKE